MANPEVREWSGVPLIGPGDPPGYLRVVVRPSWRSRSVREAIPEVREWSGDNHGGPRVVGSPSRRSGCGRVAITDVREWSRGPTGGREALPEVGRPSQKSGSGREALPEVREWSRHPPGGPGVFGRPSRKSGSGREATPEVRLAHPKVHSLPFVHSRTTVKVSRPIPDLRVCSRVPPEVREWSRGPLVGPVVVEKPSRRSGSGWEALPEVREWSEGPP